MLATAVRRISSVIAGVSQKHPQWTEINGFEQDHAARYDWQFQTTKVEHSFDYLKRNEFTHAALSTRQRSIHTADRGMYGTTVLCVRKSGRVVILADGQVTMGSEIIKPNVRKVRRIGDTVIGGFAGATADAFTLFERLESKLEEHPGQLIKAAVELAKAWRTDKFLRRLDAVMVVADADTSLTITGTGDVLEPYDGVIGIGSGGPYASAAARALIDLPDMDAEQIARKAMKIAADTCIYTNHNFTMESIENVCSASTNGDGSSPK